MSRVRSSIRRRFRSVHIPALGGLAACFSLACGGEAEPEAALQRSQSDLAAAQLAPSGGKGCDAMLARFKATLLEQVAANAAAARSNPYLGNPLAGSAVPAVPVARGGAVTPPEGTPAGSSSPRFSVTTPIVPGLDPADLIKAEGDRIYLVHDRSLLVLDASDASNTRVIATVSLGDGPATDLLVHEGRAVVFSNVYEGIVGAPRPLDPYLVPSYFAKLTIVDVTGDAPAITRESYFEGSYYVAERAGSIVRSFLQQSNGVSLDYPPVSYVDIFGDPRSQEDIDRQVDLWVEMTTETIAESTIEDYLPEQYERVDGELRSVPVSCSSLVLPYTGQGFLGGSALVSLDLADPEASPVSLSLFGYAPAAALSANTAILIQQDYGSPAETPPEVQSLLHAFEFDGLQGRLAGSTAVPGYLNGALGVNEDTGVVAGVFSRDVYETVPGSSQVVYQRSESRLHTFDLTGGLAGLAQTAAFPGDYAQGVRIDEDRAYVTSYGLSGTQLTVVDLADARAPVIGGSVELGSGNGALVPFGEGQLLTVTQAADPITFAYQLELSVVDVQDAAAPVLGASISLGQDAYSEASYEPRAFGFHPDESLVSLPVESYSAGTSSVEVFQLSDAGWTRLGGVTHARPELTLLECLALMGYPTDPEFVETLDEELISSLLLECSYYRGNTARRGLFRGDELFALSTVALTAHELDSLAAPPLSRVELPAPVPAFGPPGPAPVPIDVVPAGEPAAEE